jgi:hypothetical protein
MNPPSFRVSFDTITVDVQAAQKHVTFVVRAPPWLPPGYALSPEVQVSSKEPRVMGELPPGFDLSMFDAPEVVNFSASVQENPDNNTSLGLDLQREPSNVLSLPPSDAYTLAETHIAGRRAQIIRYKQAFIYRPDAEVHDMTPTASASTRISCVVDGLAFGATKQSSLVSEETLIQILTAWINAATP